MDDEIKKTKIIWRLKEQPTASNLQELVKNGILTKEEAREILFSSETVEERGGDSFKAEIRFLRELVEKLAQSRSQVVEVIREIQVPYKRWDWNFPYQLWCGDIPGLSSGSTGTFSDIVTF